MTEMARGAAYAFLARALAYPAPQHREETEEHLVPLLSRTELPPPCGPLLKRALERSQVNLEDLRRAHGRVFTAVESQDCPTYETAYVPGDVFRQAHTMADVAGFYRAHGLIVGGLERVRPDHIAAELEFMGFMARKEAYARQHLTAARVRDCRRTQRTFLRDHLGVWGPGFGRRLGVVAEDPFYSSLGDLLAAWLEFDMSTQGIEPAQRLDQPLPQPPADDGSCGVEAGAALGPPAWMSSLKGPV